MPIFFVTKRSDLGYLFKTSLRTFDVISFAETSEVLSAMDGNDSKSENILLAIDLSTTADAARLIRVLRSSPDTSGIPIVTIGTASDFNSLDPAARAAITEVLHVSATAREIETSIAKHLKPGSF